MTQEAKTKPHRLLPHRLLSDQQRRYWLRLFRAENVGPISFRALINRFGSAEAALEALPGLARSGGRKNNIQIPSWDKIDTEIDTINRIGAQLIAIGEPGYPPLLHRIENPPPLITAKGYIELALKPAVAIVGARNASLVGMKFAESLASKIGSADFVITSGLARGIDTAAHRGSLSTGTVAVMAGGLNHPYPPENRSLFEAIADQGLLITERPIDCIPRAQDFPRRNRLVAGMSYGLLVVEAAMRSGSLLSARLANEMGRLVFAVPGSPLDPRSAGTNYLLKEGAILATEAEDIISALSPLLGRSTFLPDLAEPDDLSTTPPPDDTDRSYLLEALSPTPISIDEIIRYTELHPAQISLILLELELAGRLERHPGNRVSLLLLP